ncbi:SusE domain-containing protein, partial [Escherichia coli]
ATALVESIILDVTDPAGMLELLTWEPARLGYNEEITYNVYLKYGEGEDLLLASEFKETLFSITVDELNEAAVAAGAPEAVESNLDFTVKAFSATYQTGVISNAVTIAITTYIATYPDYIYVPGAYQGWDPASAPKIKHSSITKGMYEGMVDLSVEGGGEVGFKFSPVPAWENDFAIANIEKTTFGNGYTALTGKGTTGGDITAPSGMYNILLNKKLNTLYMIQVET